MKIPLTQGKSAIVDDDDFAFLKVNKWRLSGSGYAERAETRNDGTQKTISMHRVLSQCPPGKHVDHINGDKLDNRKVNLRICTNRQNKQNCGPTAANKSGFKGVSFDKARGKWKAVIGSRQLGRFDCPIEAAKVYDQAALKYHKSFANINFKENA